MTDFGKSPYGTCEIIMFSKLLLGAEHTFKNI